jgi:putative membrane protein insertion efficiency factor
MQILNQILRSFLLLLIGAYRTIGTTHLGGSCRFEPSCSEYALEAARLHPPHKAVRLIASRVVRCRPGGSFGYDPVPLKEMT